MAKWGSERYKIAFRVCVRLNWMIIEDENKKWNLQSKKVEVGKSKKKLKVKKCSKKI